MTDRRIDEIETVEDLSGTSFMVHLKPGYRLEDAHTFGAASKAEIARTMRRVKSCRCDECSRSRP